MTDTLVAPETAKPETTYDDIPYPSHPYEATHPDHIYTLGKLFRTNPKVPDEASVLELGCASGGNLIPVAAQMPNARFVGVDLSTRQIEEGKARIEKLGLKNIELRAVDFNKVDESYGKFDYITCHGVFSWVPREAQERVFEICRDHLTENGYAYISYNAYPGWFMRGMIRQIMLHHVQNVQEPKDKILQARALLKFLVDSTEGQTTPYAQFLKDELEMLSKHSDSYLFHEHLESQNNPMFFYEFVDMAHAKDLQFVSETHLASMITSNLPEKAAKALTELTDNLHHRSQYTDFVTNRMFRQSLLTHKGVQINRHLDETSLEGLRFVGQLKVEKDEEAENQQMVKVTCPNGRVLRTPNPVLKAFFQSLAEAWPSSLDVPELVDIVDGKLAETIEVGQQQKVPTKQVCMNHLLQMMVRGDIEFRFLPDRFISRIDEKPQVSALARMQAETGESVTTQRHNLLNVDPFTRLLIPLLDGTRSETDLAAHVGKLIADGVLNVNVKTDKEVDMDKVHHASVKKVLEQLRRSAMLIASN